MSHSGLSSNQYFAIKFKAVKLIIYLDYVVYEARYRKGYVQQYCFWNQIAYRTKDRKLKLNHTFLFCRLPLWTYYIYATATANIVGSWNIPYNYYIYNICEYTRSYEITAYPYTECKDCLRTQSPSPVQNMPSFFLIESIKTSIGKC